MGIKIRDEIKELVKNIHPFDSLESKHIDETLEWIETSEEIFRIEKPDIPNKHLVSYFCLYDQNTKKILLVEHKKAQLWLPPGGHVDPGEHPNMTAVRECSEELNIEAIFLVEAPIFVTSTLTVGLTAGHIDVSLWYILEGNSQKKLDFDEKEFSSVKWFDLDNIPFEKSDPHMKRFVSKLKEIVQ